ncbi:PotD/PotF family extracellular solute-binding protein [Natribaculum luteum]|uniref:PotD/PotF family extracellular solute-binding protein n=1 Tax=Natribaculum luteum TaxID=1586232 RepID=A0ABD5NWC5_9EURY|nr:extracellular solute-binding protein [Natribaculum luteum]
MRKEDNQHSRRDYLKVSGTAATGILAGFAGCTGGSDNSGNSDQLNLFSWGSGYADDQFIEPFEEEHDCEVVVETFTSNADAVNKLRSIPEGTYDIVQPTNYAVERMMGNDMLEPLRLENIPAYEEYIFDELKLDVYEEDGDVYAVPATFGSTGFTYKTDTEREISTPPSIDIFWNDRFEGRMSTRDNAKVQVFYAALKLGQDPNNPDDLEAIEEELYKHAELVRTFWTSGEEVQQIMKSGEVDIMYTWDGDANLLKDEGLPVEYSFFEEGTKGWVDNQCVVKGAKHRTLAEKWIDFCASDAARDWMELNGYAIPSSAVDYTEEETEKYRLNSLDQLTIMNMVSDEMQREYDEIWSRVKSR